MKYEATGDSPNPNEKHPSKGRGSTWLKSIAAAGAMLMHPGGSTDAEAASSSVKGGGSVAGSEMSHHIPGAEIATHLRENLARSDWSYEVYHTFFKKDAQGNEVFNPGFLLFPLEVAVTKEEKKSHVAQVAIPYQYARLYDSAKAIDPEAAEKTREYIKAELLKQFGENVHNYGWVMTDGVLESKRPLASDLSKITSVKIVGYSSPEGKTPESLVQGHIEEENVVLAEKRAEDAGKMMPTEIPQEVMDRAAFSGEEAQFTEDDAEELSQAASDYLRLKNGGSSAHGSGFRLTTIAEMQREIFEVVRDYNAGKMNGNSDPEMLIVKQTFDKVLASKRTATVEVEGEEGKRDTYIIPIPNLLWLLLIPLLRRRNTPVPVPPPEIEPLQDIIPQPLPFTLIPENVESGEFWAARYNTLRDIYTAFDNAENIAGGLDYRMMCVQLEQNFDRFATDEDRITWLSHHILDQWMDYDAKKLGTDRVNLNYKNEAHQLMYARLHAEELFEAVEDHMRPVGGTANDDYMLTIWGNYTEAYEEIAEAVIHPQNTNGQQN